MDSTSSLKKCGKSREKREAEPSTQRERGASATLLDTLGGHWSFSSPTPSPRHPLSLAHWPSSSNATAACRGTSTASALQAMTSLPPHPPHPASPPLPQSPVRICREWPRCKHTRVARVFAGGGRCVELVGVSAFLVARRRCRRGSRLRRLSGKKSPQPGAEAPTHLQDCTRSFEICVPAHFEKSGKEEEEEEEVVCGGAERACVTEPGSSEAGTRRRHKNANGRGPRCVVLAR